MGILPKRGLPKFKLFDLLSWTNEIFKVGKHKGNTMFDNIWDTKMRGASQTRPPKLKNLNR